MGERIAGLGELNEETGPRLESASSKFQRWKEDHRRESLTKAEGWEFWSLFYSALAETESKDVADIAAFEMVGDPVSMLALDFGHALDRAVTDTLTWHSLYERAVVLAEDIRHMSSTRYFGSNPSLMTALRSICLQVASEARSKITEAGDLTRSNSEILTQVTEPEINRTRDKTEKRYRSHDSYESQEREIGRLRRIYQERRRNPLLEKLDAARAYIPREGLKMDISVCQDHYRVLYDRITKPAQ